MVWVLAALTTGIVTCVTVNTSTICAFLAGVLLAAQCIGFVMALGIGVSIQTEMCFVGGCAVTLAGLVAVTEHESGVVCLDNDTCMSWPKWLLSTFTVSMTLCAIGCFIDTSSILIEKESQIVKKLMFWGSVFLMIYIT